ncbi:MAG TPA: hypothetical protein PK006_04060 [Saprospiraceae bacterium]|nr:hypothetical protein [Saprospiraceae bacterium]
MKKANEHWIDELFRKKLADAEVKDSSHLWEGIEAQLDGRRDSRKSFLWMSFWLMVLTILAAGGSAAYFMNVDQKKGNIEQENEVAGKQLANLKSVDNQIVIDNQSDDLALRDNEAKDQSNLNNANGTNAGSNNGFSGTTLKSGLRKLSQGNSSEDDLKDGLTSLSVKNSITGMEAGVLSNAIGSANIELGSGQQKTGEAILLENQIVEQRNKLVVIENLPPLKSFLKPGGKKKKQLELDGCLVTRPYMREKVYVDLYFTPEISARMLEAKNQNFQSYAEKRAGAETATLSSTIGARASYVTRRGFAVRAGISKTDIKEKFQYIKGTKISWEVIKDQEGRVIDSAKVETLIVDQINNKYSFIDIPILAGYEFEMRDFVLSANLGLGLNLSAKQSGRILSPDLTGLYNLEGPFEGNNQIYKTNVGASLMGSFGLNYKLRPRLTLLLEPSFRYFIKDITTPSYALSHKYFQTGLLIGLRYRIK